ncbi:REST corepressor 2 isoform X1 [Tribolium castaneum]|uniref:REST corepressor 2 isoform X1 n=1 Tax=Tribolium castaneum TaxID=7070 RepID=UPI0001C0C568|nr:PREDICTED: REST corepressor 2 isoform X1 [Tribolium castaneum]|eukprot:XP_015834843.1 PREDICTED: REST corepressor 2 isoform X1 [Tribolium castaneum]
MVLAEKNSENARNGRSRGPSPNGHVQDSTSEDESSVPVDKIRVGRDYQAICPELQPESQRKPELLADRALLVWSPTESIPESKLEDYIVLAKDKYGYNGEQALGMLFWHKHDLDRAVLDLANFTPFPDEWSVEDKVLFEQAFQFHGKSFHRIRQMLPDKSIASLVKYYYSWKKTRSRTSLMDKQARKLNTPKEEGGASEAGSEGGSNEESDHDDKKWTIHRGIRRKSGSPSRTGQPPDENATQGEGGACSNCGVACTVTQVTSKGSLCNSCYQHWRRTGLLRPTSGPTGGKRGSPLGGRHKRKPPRGMYINHDDLAAMASGNAGVLMLKAMDRELDSLQRQIQQNKQNISSLKRKHADSIEDLRPTNDNSSRINARWTNEELLLAVQGVRKYGKDFKSIAEVLGNKTEHHVRTFFVNYRKRYNLDNVLKDWEKDNGPLPEDNGDVKVELDDSNNDNDVICISPTPKKEMKNGKVTQASK